MKVTIHGSVYVRDDHGKSVALCETVVSTKKATEEQYERENVIGYFPDVATATEHYLKLKMNESDQEYSDLNEYIKDLRNLYKEVKHDFSKERKKIN